MLGKITGFEIRYQILSPAFIAIFAIYFLLVFGGVTIDQIQIGSTNLVNVNSPFAITINIFIFSLFGMFIPTVFLVSGILRDSSFKTEELFYTTRVREFDYLVGRFIGGYLITALAFASVPLAIFIGSLMPWLDPETLGPNSFMNYFWPYLIIGLPNLMIAGMIMFTVANLSKSLVATWVTLVGLFILWVVGNVFANEPQYRDIVALADPFGGNAFGEIVREWTPAEQNTLIVPLRDELLWNRVLWLGVSAVLFVANLFLFSFRKRRAIGAGRKAAKRVEAPFVPAHIELPVSQPTLGGMASWRQLRARVGFEVKGVVFNVAFWVLLAFGILNVVGGSFLLASLYGTPSYPLTRIMIDAMIGAFAIIPIIVVIYYASEVVWREKAVRFSDIVDAAPTPSWVFMTAKLSAMFVVLTGLIFAAVLTVIATQVIRGYFNIEFDQYVIRSFVDLIIPLTFLSAIAIFLQVLTNNKWLGILAMGVLFIVTAFVLPNIGLSHGLYLVPFISPSPYTDMNGYGHFLGIQMWWHLYWGGVSLFLFALAFALWNRGAAAPIWQRLAALPRSFSAGSAGLAAVSALVAIVTGGWIFYNTTILNEFVPGPEGERRAAAFEREWRDQLEGVAQPTITDVSVDVDIYPDDRSYTASGTYVLENQTDGEIPVVWVSYGTDNVVSHSLEGADGELRDDYANLHAFTLTVPMQPGERRELRFETVVDTPGFANGGNVSTVNYNGTFFNNGEFAPVIGFSRGSLIQDPEVRRRQGLPDLERAFDIEDAEHWDDNAIRQDADFVNFRTTVSTSADQIAVAPGYLAREWTEGDRRYFEYVMDVPILNFFNWMSAEYTLLEAEQDGVLFQVFYHGPHDWNVDRMMQAAQDSIAYFSEIFSPYQYRQYRMFEFPAYASFAQSFPNTIAYSESIGFTADLRDADNIDYVYYVTAHEAAHQWWAHQVMSANVQGGTMLVETFAQYSALMLMKQEYGEDQMRRFLRYELDTYLSARSNETREELPLYLVENQPHIHYRKGAVIMYALQDYLGEDVVNRAMQRLITEFQYQSEPYARSVDFLRILREEAGPEWEEVIADFFERITLFDLEVTSAETREVAEGEWETTIQVAAHKFYADGQGEETEAPIDYGIDIGLFRRNLEGAIEGTDHILYFERRQVNESEMEFVIRTSGERPLYAGIDPYNKLIDRDINDNLVSVDWIRDEAEAGGEDADETGGGEEAASE